MFEWCRRVVGHVAGWHRSTHADARTHTRTHTRARARTHAHTLPQSLAVLQLVSPSSSSVYWLVAPKRWPRNALTNISSVEGIT